jgi:integrase
MTLIDTINFIRTGIRPEDEIKAYMAREFPTLMRALRIIDTEYSEPKRRKGFNLVKRENKKHGFLYYVRYSHEGKMIPSKWNTRTKNREEAEQFARENRDRLVGRYLREHDSQGFQIFEKFYEADSEYLACEEKRNRSLSDTTRRNYFSVLTTKFLPFLKERGISCYEQVTVKTLSDFQDQYLAAGLRPQTVNDYLKSVKRVFSYLLRKGFIKENPCAHLKSIPVHRRDKKERGCYEIEKLEGVFNKRWPDQKRQLLCLLIYTTGMRNSEIARMRPKDIISLETCRFIDIKESKTENGVRLVPLHERVYRKLKDFSKGAGPEDRIFKNCTSVTFSDANHELARVLKADKEASKNITFYSGRHFWKTLMNSEGLGEEVEEIFMGHKVSTDVSKLYNHRDKQGKALMIKKAKQVFSILDKRIFRAPESVASRRRQT